MNKEDILFDSKEEKEATERVLALVRVKTIAKEIDELISEIISYASNIDKILERNNLEKRYLERITALNDLSLITLDEDLEKADFRVREIVEDYIKRINTRLELVKNNDLLIKELKSSYAINESEAETDINLARIRKIDFEE